MEGKALAIDSSIWIYQFQATMRDKDGRVLINAHVLGFLRRISKLLFYGIKPVFVFDGGAPAIKRTTIVSQSVRYLPYTGPHDSLLEREEEEEERRR
jgi:DNA excision repair protein ERCC-5